MSTQLAQTGLLAEDRPVALEGVHVRARIMDVAAEIIVKQRYRNIEDKPIEATYVFPLPDEAAVAGFAAVVGGRRIEGRVEEREKAFELYDEAMAQGHGAFLLDQERTNIFTASVGNLDPGDAAEIELRLITVLHIADDRIRFTLPTTVSPRYAPPGSDPVDLDRISPPVASDVPYRISIAVEIAGADRISGVRSPSHEIVQERRGDEIHIALRGEITGLDRDFVLETDLAEPYRPAAFAAKEEDGTRTLMVRFFPEFDRPVRADAREVIFLLDCSGSMQGSSIDQARRALELCLRTLMQGDTFNIVRFGSTAEFLYDVPKDYSEKTLAGAVQYLRGIDADLGGTEILSPLQEILNRPVDPERTRQIVLLTDGEVANEQEVFDLARSHRGEARIFSFGIGYGPNESLVRGLARATDGAAEFVGARERIEDAVLRQFSRLDSPALAGLELDWGGCEGKQAPFHTPPLFDGDSFTAFFRIRGPEVPGSVALTARIGDEPVRWEAEVSSAPDRDLLIPALWARERIRDLEEGRSELHERTGSRQEGRRRRRVESGIIEVARRYGLTSSMTSFVAVEYREGKDRTVEPAVLRRMPIMLTRDWHGAEGVDSMLMDMSVASASRPSKSNFLMMKRAPSILANYAGPDECMDSSYRYADAEPVSWLQDLLLGQSAAGDIAWSDRAAEISGKEEEEWIAIGEEAGVAGAALWTALAVALLKNLAPDEEPLWRRAVIKAETWLRDNLPEGWTVDSAVELFASRVSEP